MNPETPPAPEVVKPPRQLGEHGQKLWQAITEEYEIANAFSVELLAQACAALDRAESCAAEIAREGEIVVNAKGERKDNPLIKHEIQARAFVTRTLLRLELAV